MEKLTENLKNRDVDIFQKQKNRNNFNEQTLFKNNHSKKFTTIIGRHRKQKYPKVFLVQIYKLIDNT